MKPNWIVVFLASVVLTIAVVAVLRSPGSSDSPGPTKGRATETISARPTAPKADDATVYKVPLDDSPARGKPSALVTIVEFSDYQCPFCSRGNETIEQLESQYGEKLRVVMKQRPLSFHPHAKGAALAALSAGEQGKYWEMHKKLFANQLALDEASLERYAKEIGLNVSQWKETMKSPKLAEILERDEKLGDLLRVDGTPAFFINGRKISGAQPLQTFKSLVDDELAKAQGLVKSGMKPDQVYANISDKAFTPPPPPPPVEPPKAVAPATAQTVHRIDIPADSPAKGPKTAKVTLVEWSDFECPYCSRVNPTLKQLESTYGKDLRIVFRHQPLSSMHAHAKLAAEAAMAAHAQGKFWPYHDKLFANQQALDRASLEKYATEVGLNLAKFKKDLDKGAYRAKVEADSAAGNAVGAQGTPTVFINGRQLVGAQPFESFKPVIDDEIQKANKLLASGTKPEKLYATLMASAVKPSPPSATGEGAAQHIEVGSAPVKGPKTAPVTIVEYSDFQCPFCSRAVPTLKAIEQQYGNKVRMAFKNQPLPFHQNARLAAAAALAAHEQGKFWEYHDKLFANQQALDRASLEKYAQELRLNLPRFKSALDSNKFEAQIAADSAEGTRLGATGTPTFFINGRLLSGAQPIEAFKPIIDEELKKHASPVKQARARN